MADSNEITRLTTEMSDVKRRLENLDLRFQGMERNATTLKTEMAMIDPQSLIEFKAVTKDAVVLVTTSLEKLHKKCATLELDTTVLKVKLASIAILAGVIGSVITPLVVSLAKSWLGLQ